MSRELIYRILSSIILIPLSIIFIFKGSIFFNLFILSCLVISIYEWKKICNIKNFFIPGIIFLLFSFYSVYALRNNFDNYGLSLILLVSGICVCTDIGGYVFGKIFKGPKLTKISPNKTYSGMLGGIFLSFAFIFFFHKYTPTTYYEIYFGKLNFIIIAILLSISLISQIGDIIISYFKRISKTKNTGKLIPGHGGLLDRIDGMIFAYPFSYCVFILLIR